MESSWRSAPALTGAGVTAALSASVIGVEMSEHPYAYDTDFQLHVKIAQGLFHGGLIPVHPGLHVVTDAVAFLTPLSIERSMGVVLVIAVCASYFLTYAIVEELTPLSQRAVATLSVVLGVVSALWIPWFNKYIYLGQGTPNVWHNPTSIIVLPFALATTWAALRWLEEPSTRRLVVTALLLAVSMPFKPSFAVVFAPAFGLLVAARAFEEERLRPVRDVALAMVPAAIILKLQYGHDESGKGGTTAFDPLVVLRRGTPNWGISVLLLLAFPIIVVAVAPEVLRDVGVRLAWLMVIVGFLERALLVESDRVSAGNWSWGYFIAVRLLFVLSAAALLRTRMTRDRLRIALGVLGLQLLSGAIYAVHLLGGKSYL